MKKKFLLIFAVLFLLLPVTLLEARTFGPFKVQKVEKGYYYFTGEDSFRLSTRKKYKIFKILVGGYPTSLTQVQPVGIVRIYSVAEKSGILYFPLAETTSDLRVNDRFFLVHGKFIELENRKENLQEKPELTSLIDGAFNMTYYNSDLNVSGLSASYKLLNLYAAISIEFKLGYYNLKYLKEEEVPVNEDTGETQTVLVNSSLSAFYLILLGGFDTGKQALMLGPVLGVVDDINATGFDMYIRMGDLMGSNFSLQFLTLPRGELYYEFDLGARILVSAQKGYGIGFHYKIGTHPDVNNANHILLFGVSKLTSHSIFSIMAGMGIAGENYRGPTLSFRGGIKF